MSQSTYSSTVGLRKIDEFGGDERRVPSFWSGIENGLESVCCHHQKLYIEKY